MNVLIVGNGFDLAHDMPTSYWDCLYFLQAIENCSLYQRDNWNEYAQANREMISKVHFDIRPYLNEFFINSRGNQYLNAPKMKLLADCVHGSFWLNHFTSRQETYHRQGRNWIDFEREISSVIKKLEELISKSNDGDSEDLSVRPFYPPSEERQQKYKNIIKFCQSFLPSNNRLPRRLFTYEDIENMIAELYADLERFTTAIEIYLGLCIKYVKSSKEKRIADVESIGGVDKVLSFNYTDVFRRYMPETSTPSEDICFIHGYIRSEPTDFKSPLVLGIDEYLSDSERDRNVNFAMFKKYFQRIWKDTDYNYLNWRNEALSVSAGGWPINLYIFGHSLDVTDKDVLKQMICNSSTKTTIFYRSDHQYEAEMKNLIRIIGSDELTAKTRNIDRSLFFVKQHDYK